MSDTITIDNNRIHINASLTNNLLLDLSNTSKLKIYGSDVYPRQDAWALAARVYITTNVHERLDADNNTVSIVGHLRVQTTPFTLTWYAANQVKAYAYVKAAIKDLVNNGSYTPFTEGASDYTIQLPETF